MINLTLTQALEKLNNREISAVELTRAYLDRIEKYGADLNCYITTTPERAMAWNGRLRNIAVRRVPSA